MKVTDSLISTGSLELKNSCCKTNQSANYSTFSSCRIPLKKKNHAFLLSRTSCT